MSHIAEKLHAYTMPRSRPNSRIKDLPDIALLASAGAIDAATLRSALEKRFEFRATHALPDHVPQPPAAWSDPYAAMAASDALAWLTLAELHQAVDAFLAPVLTAPLHAATWNPVDWSWL